MAKWWPFSKSVPAIQIDALVIPAGATVLLRPPEPLTKQQLEGLKEAFLAETTRNGARFLLVADAEWQAAVIPMHGHAGTGDAQGSVRFFEALATSVRAETQKSAPGMLGAQHRPESPAQGRSAVEDGSPSPEQAPGAPSAVSKQGRPG